MQTGLINTDDINGAARDLGVDPEAYPVVLQDNFDTASMSSRLRKERAEHMSVQNYQQSMQDELQNKVGGGMMRIGKDTRDPRHNSMLNPHQ